MFSNGHCAPENDFDEIRIPVPWGYITGKWWGPRNVRPVLAIHGWQDNAGSFDTLAPLLKKAGISVLCIDLPGHGMSSHYPEGPYYYIFWDGLVFVRRIVQHFNWEKVTLMGHSLGGGISFLYAGTYPEEVDKYVSLDIASPLVRDPARVIKQLGNTIDRFLKFEKMPQDQQPSYDYEEMIDVVEDAYKGGVNRKCCEILMKRGMTRVKNENMYLFSRDLRLKALGLAFPTADQTLLFASRIKCEVLNIRGDPGMTFDKPEYFDIMIEKIKENAKRAECHYVHGTHHLHLNHPERVASIIIDFLKS